MGANATILAHNQHGDTPYLRIWRFDTDGVQIWRAGSTNNWEAFNAANLSEYEHDMSTNAGVRLVEFNLIADLSSFAANTPAGALLHVEMMSRDGASEIDDPLIAEQQYEWNGEGIVQASDALARAVKALPDEAPGNAGGVRDIARVAGTTVAGVADFRLAAADVWAHATRTLTAFTFEVTTDSASREASKATGFSTFDHTTDTVTTDSASREASKATGFSTPAQVEAARDAILDEGGEGPWTTGEGGNGNGGDVSSFSGDAKAQIDQIESNTEAFPTDGDVEVNHDTGGTDNLRYVKPGGNGIDNANVRAYRKTDYDAGTFTVRGRAITDADGRWVTPMFLNSGLDYTIVFEKPGAFGPDTKEVSVP